MIRLSDATTLAYTKLRTHKVRTGLTVGVAGILFGVLLGGIFVGQGIFESIDRFSEEGLASRSIVEVQHWDSEGYNVYEHAGDSDLINEVRQAHKELVAKKTKAAEKYGVTYDAETEDPSPIERSKDTGKEQIREDALNSEIVQQIAERRSAKIREPFDINAFLARYSTAKVITGNSVIRPTDGMIVPMGDGKEKIPKTRQERISYQLGVSEDMPTIQVLNDSLTEPFTMRKNAAIPEGELPAVVSFSYAEKLLGLKALQRDSTNEQRQARLQEVRQRVGEVTASFCYRNTASQNLLAQATAQFEEMNEKSEGEYEEPPITYKLPADDSCGAVTIVKDTRTAAEKRLADNYTLYQKEIGEFIGEPEQHKITLRAIGLSGDLSGDQMAGDVGSMVMGLLSSWLGYGNTWSIPADMLTHAPAELRPVSLFPKGTDGNMETENDGSQSSRYLVEFGDKKEARDALQRGGAIGGAIEDNTMVSAYGSGTLIVDELKHWFLIVLLWALAIVGGIALVILASLIGRMVSDGRRESAVFRAIGARRGDIARIYSMYALLLSLRVACFALILGFVLSVGVDIWLSADATLGARVAYAAVDTAKEFHFVGIGTWYVPAILVAIIITGLLASIIPILLGARRNPINDMRDDT